MTKFHVQYEVEGFSGLQKAGPYETYDEAFEHSRDIAGFEGVSGVTVIGEEHQS